MAAFWLAGAQKVLPAKLSLQFGQVGWIVPHPLLYQSGEEVADFIPVSMLPDFKGVAPRGSSPDVDAVLRVATEVPVEDPARGRIGP